MDLSTVLLLRSGVAGRKMSGLMSFTARVLGKQRVTEYQLSSGRLMFGTYD